MFLLLYFHISFTLVKHLKLYNSQFILEFKTNFAMIFKGQSGKGNNATGTSEDRSMSMQGSANLYGSNLTVSSSTSSAVGFTQDNSLLCGGNLLTISQHSSRSSSMSRYSNWWDLLKMDGQDCAHCVFYNPTVKAFVCLMIIFLYSTF